MYTLHVTDLHKSSIPFISTNLTKKVHSCLPRPYPDSQFIILNYCVNAMLVEMANMYWLHSFIVEEVIDLGES